MSKPKSKHGNRYSPEFKREAVLTMKWKIVRLYFEDREKRC